MPRWVPPRHDCAHSGTPSTNFDLATQPCFVFLSTQTPCSPVWADPLTFPTSTLPSLPFLGLESASSHLPITSPSFQQPDGPLQNREPSPSREGRPRALSWNHRWPLVPPTGWSAAQLLSARRLVHPHPCFPPPGTSHNLLTGAPHCLCPFPPHPGSTVFLACLSLPLLPSCKAEPSSKPRAPLAPPFPSTCSVPEPPLSAAAPSSPPCSASALLTLSFLFPVFIFSVINRCFWLFAVIIKATYVHGKR